MANHQTITQWFLHGTGVQLQQGTTVWHDAITTYLLPLPIAKATIIISHLQHQAGFDTIELTIKPLLHAKHDLINSCRARPTI
jgi:hypothetical protein